MPTPRKPTVPTTEAIDQFCAQFDDLFGRYEERQALRQYLIGLLLPREHNKTLVELASLVPGAQRQALHHFLHDAPWDGEALNQRRLQLWQAHPFLGPMPRAFSLSTRPAIPSGATGSSSPLSSIWGSWGMWRVGWSR